MPKILEDILGEEAPSNPAQGMQMPQPLKTSMHHNVNYTAAQNTLTNFNHFSGMDNANSMAFQKNAIRGKIAEQHVYNWNVPISQPKTDMSDAQQQPMPFISDPKEMLRRAISDVYRNPIMIKTHTFNQFSVFKVPVQGLMEGVFRYIVAIVPNYDHVPLGGKHHLGSLPWICFQSRSTNTPALEFGESRPPASVYTPPGDAKSPLFDIINMKLDDTGKFIYLSDTLPLKVELLKLKDTDVAAPRATVWSALEAFKTVLTFVE